MTEDVRLNAFKAARRCACRGWIIGFESVVDVNAERVVEHRQTEQHQSWDREAWIEANTAKVNVPIAKLRKIA